MGGPQGSALQPRPWRGLSGKLLALTVLFVMVGEVLIYLPSIANFRLTWLANRIATAEIAALAVEAAPDRQVPDGLRQELLTAAGIKVVAVRYGEARHLMLKADGDLMIDQAYDLRAPGWLELIGDAFTTLLFGGDRVIGLTDAPHKISGDLIDVAVEEKPLRRAMIQFSVNILTLSIVLSLIVAALVFLALDLVLVRPIRRITGNMLRFIDNPQDPGRVIEPSGRADEIGIAERELHHLQTELSGMLNEKTRLAALGLAVSKVSHDLRNMLASAQLLSDRLVMVDDPTVKRLQPKLIASLGRAIDYCDQTLKFGRVQELPPRRERFALRPLVEEVIDTAAVQAPSHVVLYNDVPADAEIDADREQLFRALMNLIRNAAEAVDQAVKAGAMAEEGTVHVKSWREGSVVTVDVRDNGPGVPEKVRNHLFEAFRGSGRPGGTGLGLTISAELARAHGGELKLVSVEGEGACFRVVIPDRVSELRPGRRGRRGVGSAAR